jgi:hypothetical protein
VTKQFSKLSDESAQQLAQLDGVSEGKLNELLDRLEAEKSRLSDEDQPIINWGIGVIRTKTIEQAKRRKEMMEELDKKYDNGYAHFLTVSKWDSRDPQGWLGKCTSDLNQILVETSTVKDPIRAGNKAETLGNYINQFCLETGIASAPQAIKGCINHVNKGLDYTSDAIFVECHKKAVSGLSKALPTNLR